jgi:hypothetical protein
MKYIRSAITCLTRVTKYEGWSKIRRKNIVLIVAKNRTIDIEITEGRAS